MMRKKIEIVEEEKRILAYLYQNKELTKSLIGIDFSTILSPDAYSIFKQIVYNDNLDYDYDDLKIPVPKEEFRRAFQNIIKHTFYREVIKEYKENKLQKFEEIILKYLFLYKIFEEVKTFRFEDKLKSNHITIYYTKHVMEDNIQLIQKYPTFFNIEDILIYLTFYKFYQKDTLVIVDPSTIEDVKKIASLFPQVSFYYKEIRRR